MIFLNTTTTAPITDEAEVIYRKVISLLNGQLGLMVEDGKLDHCLIVLAGKEEEQT